MHKYDLDLELDQKRELLCGRKDLQDVLDTMGITINDSIQAAVDGTLDARVEELCDQVDAAKTSDDNPFSYCYGVFRKDDPQWREERPEEEKAAFMKKTGKPNYQEAQRLKIQQKTDAIK